MTYSHYEQAAIAAGQWLLKTQVTDELDANCGRYLYCRHLDTDKFEYSTGWQTAFGVMAVLSLHRLTGERAYLDSAALAVRYIKSLQILDDTVPSWQGAFREETPQTNWMHPRDAVSAAWGLLAYANEMGDAHSLQDAERYADWMIAYAMKGDWPLCTVNLGLGGQETNELKGSFQSGGILFFLDMFDATGKDIYQQIARRMSDYYAEHFLDQQGILTVLLDTTPEIENQWPQAWRDMHRVNDDFGGIALVRSYERFGQEKHRTRLEAFIRWVLTWEKPEGGFLEPTMEVGSATVPILLQRYLAIAPSADKPGLEQATTRCLDHLLTFQQTSKDVQIQGAFLGLDNHCQSGHGQWVNIRCTAYAILALLQVTGHSIFPLTCSQNRAASKA